MKKRLISSFVGIAALALLIVSCEKPDAELVGPLWILESVVPEGASAIKPDPTRTYTIQFFADSTFTGVVDCDDLFGQYWPENGSIKRFGDGGVTRRDCAEADPLIDEYFPVGFMRSRIKYKINGTVLTLHLFNILNVGDNTALNFETSD